MIDNRLAKQNFQNCSKEMGQPNLTHDLDAAYATHDRLPLVSEVCRSTVPLRWWLFDVSCKRKVSIREIRYTRSDGRKKLTHKDIFRASRMPNISERFKPKIAGKLSGSQGRYTYAATCTCQELPAVYAKKRERTWSP